MPEKTDLTEQQNAALVWLQQLTDAERVVVIDHFCHSCGKVLDDYDRNSSWHDDGICGVCAPDPRE